MDNTSSGLYIENDRLSAYAASTARLLRPAGEASGRLGLGELRRALEEIRRTHAAVQRRYADQPSPPQACEWLLDNWYMAQREYLAASAALKSAGQLRRCGEGLVILALCRALLRAGLGSVSEERCRIFLEGFQSVTVLRRAELELFPAAVRAAALEAIAAVCQSMQYAADTAVQARELEALFTTLRLFSVLDAEKLIRSADLTDAALSQDPSGDYPRMDSGTRQDYLRRVEALARQEGLEEHVFARRLVEKARAEGKHVGFYLFKEKSPRREGLYIGANVLLTLFLSLLPAFICRSAAAALLLLLPVSELVKSLMDFILLRLLHPTRLPRMDMEQGVPPEGRSICVLSALLTDRESAQKLSRRLEELRFACRSEGEGLCFGLLADLPGADREETEKDEEVLQAARAEVNRLNRKYGGGFYLFTRKRRFDGESWTGRERKRGAILELAKLLCDEKSELAVTGERDALSSLRYIITLDSDTRLYPGAAGELVGAMLHPLCRPLVDEKRRVVVRGHALIHPRMATELSSANATDFALIFAGPGGSDPYGGLCGELYMDAFDSGGFAGKGILDARVLLQCTRDRFPEGRILSHDALEGACLRGAFMGDAEFSDAFPSRPLSYYKRLHRWTRGDWQNLPWMFCRDFTAIDRFRLFDSLRRSLIAPMTLIAMTAGFFLPKTGLTVAAMAALLALLSRLFLSLAEGSARRRETVRLKRHTRLLTGVGGAIVQTFIRLWLLPYEAWICLSAIAAALWRMLVSHKRLLQWQTAAQSEAGSEGLAAHLKAMWFPAALGLGLLLFSPAIIGRSAGLMWLLSPLAAAALALPAKKESGLSSADRDFLRSAAGENFRYLRDCTTAADHYLPPDNFQEQPPVGLAHRTSPTNIGLALAAAIAAMDMELISAKEAVNYIRPMVSTLEQMPRALGHYYNWYDTRTLRPLEPPFISTVDSGNLYAGLLTTAIALEELGETALAARLRAILEPMDFSPLYDRERCLFYICYDASLGKGAGGWYDLMASEAMLTSYLAIAKGDVPVKHWRRLSRAQLQKDGYRGLASWTGTMFEYLMPMLFLPLYRGSLLSESGRFCLYAQKRRVPTGRPWGVSESAFYSLDPSLSYRYKANGCAALALKRGQDEDLVVSPYSSFLALAVDAESAVKNLRRLTRYGAVGRFGLMEALDFSPSRCRCDSGEKVRCYMAHHIGMSVIAAANALCAGSIQRRFLSAAPMGACSLLLQERLPDHGLVIRRDMAEVPEKPERSMEQRWQLRGGAEDREERLCLLSNGSYSLLSGSHGRGYAAFGSTLIYGSPRLPFREGLELRLRRGGDSRRLLPSRDHRLWELSEEQCRWEGEALGLDYSLSAWTAAGDWGELHLAEFRAGEDTDVTVSLSFRPILAAYNDYVNHTAFWKLGIRAELRDGALLLHRLRRGDREELWLCVACDAPAAFSAEKGGGDAGLADPFVTAAATLSLKADTPAALRFALCLGLDAKEALDGAKRILSSSDRGDMVGAAASRLKMSTGEIGAAMAMLRPLLTPVSSAPPRRELWRYGISGDLPLICCDGQATECLPLLRRFCLIKSCGADCELVYLSGEEGEYQRPLYRRVSETLAPLGLEPLIGCRGGVHFTPLSAAGLIEARAAWAAGRENRRKPPLRLPRLSAPRAAGTVPEHGWDGSAFEFTVNGALPCRAWQHVLTNGRLGCLTSDCGMGGIWYENAREMRVNTPPGDIRAVRGTEALWADLDGSPVSLFAANDGHPCRVRFSPGLAVWEKELGGRTVSTSLFIPSGMDARLLLIKGAGGLRLFWGMEPVMGAADASSLSCRFEAGLFAAENPESYLPGLRFLAGTNAPCSCRTDFAPPAMLFSLEAEDVTVLACGCCREEELRELCRPGTAIAALEGVKKRWHSLLSRLSLSTGDAPFDRYMGQWAVYQSIACRLEGRSSLYQSGGAFGFRDQLQDAVNLLLITPRYARERILDCCRHQYVEGDVMHWWHPHPEGDRGIRSRCSDDLLWLVWALCEYVRATGDLSLAEEEVNYVNSPVLSSEERDRYETPRPSQAAASVLFHARAALDCCISRGFGPHGLPFFGSGDWNDGLDAVNGESVWLGWFFSCCALEMAELLDKLCKPGAQRFREYAERVGKAADQAWNGRWYLRGYLSDGSPLGGEEHIDSLSQSWAALNPYADIGRARRAVDAALRRLVRREQGLVLLFDPPFTEAEPYPGYIMSYGRGFRENGGQYTHAAVWLAQACLRLDMAGEAWEILNLLLPENHDLRRYQAEPFVLAADVYSAPGHEGEAGWSWYTGSAAWYFRVAAQDMLGLRPEKGGLVIAPRLPSALPGYQAVWTDRQGRSHSIQVSGGEILADGEKYNGEILGVHN